MKVFVVTTSFGRNDEEYSILDKIPVFRVKLCKRLLVRWAVSVLRLFNNADLIHIHAVDFVGVLFVLLAKLLRKNTSITIHRGDILPTRNKLYAFIRLVALRLANSVIAVSEASRRLAISVGASPKKTSVIHNSVDTSLFKPRNKEKIRNELGLNSHNKIILFVGNLITRKGVKFLIKAMQFIVEKKPNTMLLIIGDGPERTHLEFLASKLGLKRNVIFLGRLPTHLLSLYYNASDIFVLPSLHEGHAMVLLEAMVSGLPVVATNVGGNVETVIDGVNGFLIEPSDISTLKNSILKILDNEFLAECFGNNSQKIFQEKFSETSQIKKLLKVYGCNKFG